MSEFKSAFDIDPERLLKKKYIEMYKSGELSFSYIKFIQICSEFWKFYFVNREVEEWVFRYKFIDDLEGFENTYIIYCDEFAEKFFRIFSSKLINHKRIGQSEIQFAMLDVYEMQEILSSIKTSEG